MIYLVKSKKVYTEFSNELRSFLERYEFIVDGELVISKHDLHAVTKTACDIVIKRYPKHIFVNSIKWHHFKDDKLPWESVLQIFVKALEDTGRYVSKRFTSILPKKIYDIDTADLDGDLKEELMKIKL